MNKKKIARGILYVFVLLNIFAIGYFSYTNNSTFSIEKIKVFLVGTNLYLALIAYTLIMILRGLTLFPGTPLIVLGAIIFPFSYVMLSLIISVQCYIYLIHKYSEVLDFMIPKKIIDYKPKIEKHGVIYIVLLCLIPGMSMNILAYFLSMLQVSLRNKMIGIGIGSTISIVTYLFLFKWLFNFFV